MIVQPLENLYYKICTHSIFPNIVINFFELKFCNGVAIREIFQVLPRELFVKCEF